MASSHCIFSILCALCDIKWRNGIIHSLLSWVWPAWGKIWFITRKSWGPTGEYALQPHIFLKCYNCLLPISVNSTIFFNLQYFLFFNRAVVYYCCIKYNHIKVVKSTWFSWAHPDKPLLKSRLVVLLKHCILIGSSVETIWSLVTQVFSIFQWKCSASVIPPILFPLFANIFKVVLSAYKKLMVNTLICLYKVVLPKVLLSQ